MSLTLPKFQNKVKIDGFFYIFSTDLSKTRSNRSSVYFDLPDSTECEVTGGTEDSRTALFRPLDGRAGGHRQTGEIGTST